MKIISLNLHCLKEENIHEKMSRVARFILDNDIDICLLQEVAQLYNEKILYDNIKYGNNADILLSFLENKYHIYFEAKKLGFGIYEEGLVILSKNPLINKGYAYISHSVDFNNWMTRIALFADYNNITFYNIHLGWSIGDETIEYQIDNLAKMAKEHSNLVMILGDYNCCHNSPQYKYFLNKGFLSVTDILNIDILNTPTFIRDLDNGQKDNRVIDHIFINKPINIKDYKVIFNDNPVSDHNLVYLEFEEIGE